MARIVVGSYMVRYPLGGMMSWVLQYLVGFRKLGHDVYLVEKSGYPSSCYDPAKDLMGDDCGYGTRAVDALLTRFGLCDRWCYVDEAGGYHGLSREAVEAVCASADLFLDMGSHGDWREETVSAGARVLVDGEPGFTQLKMEKKTAAGERLKSYDYYYTSGANVGTERCTVSGAGREWRHLFHPVAPEMFDMAAPPAEAPFTTIMNWRSYEPVSHGGRTLYHKDVEFEKFAGLPGMTPQPLQIAVSGADVPVAELRRAGWRVCDAHRVTATFDSFREYITASRGEFSVCKNGFVATCSGWFSDRSAAYLAAGRPVVLEETGFSAHLPCGRGLLAVRDADEAAAAVDAIAGAPGAHARAAREIAAEYLAAEKVLGRFLGEVGL